MTAIPMYSKTPDDISIKARNVSFSIEESLSVDWADNDPFLTALFNAMSISFPSGEKNFIDSVRPFEKQIEDKKLLSEIKGFYKQEGIHSREHMKYNNLLCTQRDYDLDELESVYLKRIDEGKKNPKVTKKNTTCIDRRRRAFHCQLWSMLFRGSIFMRTRRPSGGSLALALA